MNVSRVDFRRTFIGGDTKFNDRALVVRVT